jgi:hypothetical protein
MKKDMVIFANLCRSTGLHDSRFAAVQAEESPPRMVQRKFIYMAHSVPCCDISPNATVPLYPNSLPQSHSTRYTTRLHNRDHLASSLDATSPDCQQHNKECCMERRSSVLSHIQGSDLTCKRSGVPMKSGNGSCRSRHPSNTLS